jgi:hypothetical protein
MIRNQYKYYNGFIQNLLFRIDVKTKMMEAVFVHLPYDKWSKVVANLNENSLKSFEISQDEAHKLCPNQVPKTVLVKKESEIANWI